ncbi:unnamed protein product [Bemisia tabaci]|uniref:UDP-glucuronosyltransferase n=2 Tax=Bemisia tabaci TaxID=7038 RepID=A0A9P0A4B0_BEMTA|nr:unnamed protein product [Bemisia tabaci]
MFPQSIEVGGISVHPKKPLPRELQKFMDEAKTGVIYFSFGSILAGEKMPSKQKAYFVEAFKRLDQKVIWKYEGALDIELPPNVLLQKWLPQGDILAHPNCRIFITHCGYLSLVETVDRGIPIIGIPFFADQPRNCHMAQEKGFGVHLNFDDLTPELIVDTVNKILKNKSYSDSAKRISSIFKDRVVSPVDKAVHLVEYVIRHGGNPSSQTGAKELWWFQYFLLDVTAIIIFSVLVFFMSIYKICRVIFNLLTCNSSKKTTSTSRTQSKMSKKVK